MPTLKEESFSFGGVDSRGNPANFPPDRSLRCFNFTPQASGALRLRQGYTQVVSGPVVDAPIHSAIYYEQFSSAYLGPQYVIFGQGTAINLLNMSLTGLTSNIGAFTSSNPWGHFRANNRIFIADGVSNLNWDGTTLRTTGIPSLLALSATTSGYAGTVTDVGGPGGSSAWVNPGNAAGPPDGSFATATATSSSLVTNTLKFAPAGLSVPTTSTILGIAITVTASVSQAGLATLQGVSLSLSMLLGSLAVGPQKQQLPFTHNAGVLTMTLGGPTNGLDAGLTPAIVNDPTFVVEAIGNWEFNSPSSAFWSIDALQVTVFYTAGTQAMVAVTSSSLGSIAPTVLTGYQLFAAIYNPVTQHMGNCAPIGGLNTVSDTLSAFVITDLPALSTYNSEWEYALGMTNDGGQVPYWYVDAQGNNIVLGNSATMGTVYLGNVNTLQELPVLNDVPPAFDKFARVGTRIFAGLAGNPFLSYSNDAADVSNANYVGVPEESWPADQQEPLPTGKLPTAIHAYRLEGWFFDRDTLSIWSEFLLQQGANPWRGPWPGGCPGQRAFIETPHGPFWLNSQRQLCTFMSDGVISVSEEYEASLLGKIGYQYIAQTELAYLLDKETLTDEIVIRGLDKDGNPVIVVHDFTLMDSRSQHGQGYDYSYTGLIVNTFVGSGFTPRQNVYDTSGRMRLWGGSTHGWFAQLEDGLSDNGSTISGDYIGLVGLGKNRRSVEELEYQGDANVEMSYLPDYSLTVSDMLPVVVDAIGDDVQTQSRFGGKLGGEETRWVYLRMQLDSHPGDGSFAVTDPPWFPMPTYGIINETVLKLGANRPEAR